VKSIIRVLALKLLVILAPFTTSAGGNPVIEVRTPEQIPISESLILLKPAQREGT